MDILIVEDEQPLRESLLDGLGSTFPDLDVTAVPDAEQASVALDAASPRVVISDVRLPGKDGVELFMEIRRRSPSSAFIFTSAYPSEEACREAKANGLRFLRKPFAFDELVEAITGALRTEQFAGTVGGISLVDLLQVLNMGRRTAAVTLQRGAETGRIFLRDGEVVHAAVGDEEGRSAFNRLMAWKGGSFGSEPGRKAPRVTIEESFNGLLLDVFREQDEEAFDADEEPRGDAHGVAEVLARSSATIGGCVAVGLLDLAIPGPLEAVPGDALPESVAALIPDAVHALVELASLRGLDSRLSGEGEGSEVTDSGLREFIFRSNAFVHIVQRVPGNGERVLVIVCRADSNLGTVVARARMTSRELARIVNRV